MTAAEKVIALDGGTAVVRSGGRSRVRRPGMINAVSREPEIFV